MAPMDPSASLYSPCAQDLMFTWSGASSCQYSNVKTEAGEGLLSPSPPAVSFSSGNESCVAAMMQGIYAFYPSPPPGSSESSAIPMRSLGGAQAGKCGYSTVTSSQRDLFASRMGSPSGPGFACDTDWNSSGISPSLVQLSASTICATGDGDLEMAARGEGFSFGRLLAACSSTVQQSSPPTLELAPSTDSALEGVQKDGLLLADACAGQQPASYPCFPADVSSEPSLDGVLPVGSSNVGSADEETDGEGCAEEAADAVCTLSPGAGAQFEGISPAHGTAGMRSGVSPMCLRLPVAPQPSEQHDSLQQRQQPHMSAACATDVCSPDKLDMGSPRSILYQDPADRNRKRRSYTSRALPSPRRSPAPTKGDQVKLNMNVKFSASEQEDTADECDGDDDQDDVEADIGWSEPNEILGSGVLSIQAMNSPRPGHLGNSYIRGGDIFQRCSGGNSPELSNGSAVALDALSPNVPVPNVVQQQAAAAGAAAVATAASETMLHDRLASINRAMLFGAAFQVPSVDLSAVENSRPKRRNVKISKDPQSVAARHRRERISDRIRVLQRLVPGGTKMDTASMLDEAISYVKFLKAQLQNLESVSNATGNFDPRLIPYTPPGFFCNSPVPYRSMTSDPLLQDLGSPTEPSSYGQGHSAIMHLQSFPDTVYREQHCH